MAGVAYPAQVVQLPPAEQILDKFVKALGGQAAWDILATETKKGVYSAGGPELALEVSVKAPDKWMMTVKLPNGRILRHACDGVKGWQDGGRLGEMSREQVSEEGLIYNSFGLLKLKDRFPTMTVKGIEKNGESEVYVIEATPASGRSKTLYFDVESGLLTRVGQIIFGDYRKVGAVQAPFLVRYRWQTHQFSEVRHNVPVEDAQFKMPEAPPTPPEVKRRGPLPAADGIIAKYLQALGGEAALSKLATQVRKGTIQEGDESVAVETVAKAPDKWLFVMSPPDRGPERNGFDGKVGWMEQANVVGDLNPSFQVLLGSFLDLQAPLKLRQLVPRMTVKAQEKKGSSEVVVIEVAPPGGRSQTMQFDSQTGLLTQVDATALEDYREVDGVKIPFTVLVGGEAAIRFTEVKHGVPVEDARFAKPMIPSEVIEAHYRGIEDARALAVLRPMAGQGVTPEDGRILYDLVVRKGYKRGLDIGTARGYSSMWLGLAMRKTGGRLITIEIDPETADQARANFRKAGLEDVIDSRIGDAFREIPALKGEFDFVFMDLGSPVNKKLLDLLYSKIAPGGAVTAHNASTFKRHQPDFLKAIQSDPNLETASHKSATGGISVTLKRR
jgi:predicted O-methyltransferase YrrM